MINILLESYFSSYLEYKKLWHIAPEKQFVGKNIIDDNHGAR
jgi:hypothetical protein